MVDINIRENEFRGLLDREKVLADVHRAFSPQLDLVRDLTNYGTNLIPRCFTSSDHDLKDVVLIGILLRQAVAMLDGIELLLSNGAVYAAGLQARALFEASVYIDWILQADTERKATYYYVHNVRRQRRWAERLSPGSPEAAAFAAAMPPNFASLRNPKAQEQARKTLEDVRRVLSQPTFAAANAAFDRCARKNGKGDRAWYVPLGMRSVSALVKAVGRTAEYLVFYAAWSETMHSSSYAQHVQIGKERVTFEPLRHLSQFDQLFRSVVAIALGTYRRVLEQYRSGELPVFSRKYAENWQKAFLDVPSIKYGVFTTDPI